MFRLKTAALAATMAAAALSAQASDVEVFGRLDTGVLYTVNQGDSKDTFTNVHRPFYRQPLGAESYRRFRQ